MRRDLEKKNKKAGNNVLLRVGIIGSDQAGILQEECNSARGAEEEDAFGGYYALRKEQGAGSSKTVVCR